MPRRAAHEQWVGDDDVVIADPPEALSPNGRDDDLLLKAIEAAMNDRFTLTPPPPLCGDAAGASAAEETNANGADEESEDQLLRRVFADASAAGNKDPLVEANELARRALARVRQMERELVFERTRTAEAQARAAELHVQRFVLALLCAAALPSLAVALIAHRFELHELETRSDAVGLGLAFIVLLAALAGWLYRRARLIAPAEHAWDVPQSLAGPSHAAAAALVEAGGLRQRRHHARPPPAVAATAKAELLL